MLKYLEVPDLHFDPQWADVTESVARRIAEAAQERKEDCKITYTHGDTYTFRYAEKLKQEMEGRG